MNLRQRIDLLGRLGDYMQSSEPQWLQARDRAYALNQWFTPEWIQLSVENITRKFLQPSLLEAWTGHYPGLASRQPAAARTPLNVGVVTAGNIPLVGFHDFLCVFLSGHDQVLKCSTKDNVLLPHLIAKLQEWEPSLQNHIRLSEILRSCDAYIATGSNNSSRYFEQYFGKYPSIIRRNRTSAAILSGKESKAELDKLADDIQVYFGLGCRNVTKLYVPEGYDFIPVLDALRKYSYFFDHHKYRSNFDYQLAIYIMNNLPYMTNDSIVLLEKNELFSPIGTLYYEYYKYNKSPAPYLLENQDIQCIAGEGFLPFGSTQSPRLEDFADGVDTLAFLAGL